jgi:hypothetical protein
MRSRRDPFARVTYTTKRQPHGSCDWCGRGESLDGSGTEVKAYVVSEEHDGGRQSNIGTFCSWSCAESYHDTRIAR